MLIPGHDSSLQFHVSIVFPSQPDTGSTHERVLVVLPDPQVSEHSDQELQAENPTSPELHMYSFCVLVTIFCFKDN